MRHSSQLRNYIRTIACFLVDLWVSFTMKLSSARCYVLIALYQYVYRRIGTGSRCQIIAAWWDKNPQWDLTAETRHVISDAGAVPPTTAMLLRAYHKYGGGPIPLDPDRCVCIITSRIEDGKVTLYKSVVSMRQGVETITGKDVNDVDAATLPGVALMPA